MSDACCCVAVLRQLLQGVGCLLLCSSVEAVVAGCRVPIVV